MKLPLITPLILTYNEEPNLHRCLSRLGWATEVLVLDSFSSDLTSTIARAHPNVRWVQRKFDDHTTQWNFGLDLVKTDWVLALDADYVLGPGFEAELAELEEKGADAYHARFRYLIEGKPLRASLYPPRAVLFRRSVCRYYPEGHTQMLRLPERVEMLSSVIDHDDRKSLSRWTASQWQYAEIEAGHLIRSEASQLGTIDRIRKTMLLGPLLVPVYLLIWRGLIFDGWRGLYYTWQRVLAELLLALLLLHERIPKEHSD